MKGAWCSMVCDGEWFSITMTITWRMTGRDSRAWPHAAGALTAGTRLPAAVAGAPDPAITVAARTAARSGCGSHGR